MFTSTLETAPATPTPTSTAMAMVSGIDKLPVTDRLRLERRMRDYSDMRGRALLTVYGDAPWHESRGFAGWLSLIDLTFGIKNWGGGCVVDSHLPSAMVSGGVR